MEQMLEVNEEREVGEVIGHVADNTVNEDYEALDLSCSAKPVRRTIICDVEDASPLERGTTILENATTNGVNYRKKLLASNGKTTTIVAAPDSTQSSEPGQYDSTSPSSHRKLGARHGMLVPTLLTDCVPTEEATHINTSMVIAQEYEPHTLYSGQQQVASVQRTINGPVQRISHTYPTSRHRIPEQPLQVVPDSSTLGRKQNLTCEENQPSSPQNALIPSPRVQAETDIYVDESDPDISLNNGKQIITDHKQIRKLLTTDATNKHYKCNICKRSFSKYFRAERHIKIHLGARPFKCAECGAGYNQSKTLQTHIDNQHKITDGISTTPVTTGSEVLSQDEETVLELEEVPEETERLIHAQIQEANKPYKCGTCPMQFTTYSDLEKHVAGHRSSYLHSCTVCNKHLHSHQALQEHLDWHRDKNHFYPCKKCSKTFYHAEGLADHMINIHNLKGASTARNDVVYSHTVHHYPESVHKEMNPPPPQRSIGATSYRSYAPQHITTKDSIESISMSSYDTMSTSTESSYYENSDTHDQTKSSNEQISFKLQKIQMNASSTIEYKTKTPRRYFKCSICTSTFYKDSEYNKHVKEHAEGMTFTCMACDITFSTSSELNRHYATHPGVRPYKCTVCDKAFIQATHLKFHMRRHTGEKPYQCKVCSKRFPRHAHLQEHMFLHAGEKLHRCTVCDKRFTQPTGLRSHMKRTHPDHIKQTHKCPHCPVSFESKQGRSLHILSVHQGDNFVSSSTTTAASTSTMTDDSACSSKPEAVHTLQDDTSLNPNLKQIIALPVKMTGHKIIVSYEDKLLMEWTYDSVDA